MSNKTIWRPLNTYGIYWLGTSVGFVIIYSLLELSRVCSHV